MSGCYSIEQSSVERGYRWIRRGQTDKAVATFNATIREYPQSVLAFTGLADALFEAEKDRDAIEAYTRAIALIESSKSETIKSGLRAYLYRRRGVAFHALSESTADMKAANLQYALSDYDKALQLSPGYIAAREARNRLKKGLTKHSQTLFVIPH